MFFLKETPYHVCFRVTSTKFLGHEIGVNGYILDRDDQGWYRKVYARFTIPSREARARGFSVDLNPLDLEQAQEAEALGLRLTNGGERGTDLEIDFDHLSLDKGYRVNENIFLHDCRKPRIIGVFDGYAA